MRTLSTVLIVDDDPDIRFLVRQALEAVGTLTVVAEAGTATEALAWWTSLRPDAVVLDLRLGPDSGMVVARDILSKEPSQLVVMFTGYRDHEVQRQALEIGVRACLAKTDLSRLPAVIVRLLASSEGGVA